MRSVFMNELSWVEYQARIERDRAPVLLPVGATEQHGPHLPLGTDALLATAVAVDAARRDKSQPKCGGGQHFCGTTSVDAATLIGGVRDAVREFARHGVARLVVVNGHYENQWFVTEGIDLGLRDAAGTAIEVVRLEYWDFLTGATLAAVFPDGFPGFALEHAAVIETSLMLHYHPSLVRVDLIPDDGPADFPPYDVYPSRRHWVPLSGVLSSARGADAGKGRLIAEEVAQRLAAAIEARFP